MKNKKLILIFALSLFTALLIFGGTVSQAQEKKVYIDGIDASFPPFSYIDEKGNPGGFDVDAIKWIAEEMGFKVEIKTIAWESIIPTLKLGKIDFIASGLALSEERAQQIDFCKPYWKWYAVVVVRKNCDIDAVTLLCMGNKVGVQKGNSNLINWLKGDLIDNGVKMELSYYDTQPLLIKDLLNERLDAAVMDNVSAEDAINRGMEVKVVGTFLGGEYAYAVRKGDEELKQILNEGLERLMKTPKWDELVAKYFK